MFRPHAAVAALVGSVAIAACGGSGNNNTSSGSTPTTPPPTTTNPCVSAGTAEAGAAGVVAQSRIPPPDKRTIVDGDTRGRVYAAIALHRARASTRAQTTAVTPAPVADDIGNIAVLQDAGDLVISQRPFDLAGVGLHFSPSGAGYSVSKIDPTFRTPLGNAVTLGDDDSASFTIPFSFPYYGTGQTSVFVNSDGNITFGVGDNASTDRDLTRFMNGAPRIAPFFADLDPTQGTGKVLVYSAPDHFTATWCGVRGYGVNQTVTVQSTLLPDGSVEIKFGPTVTLGDAIVGTSPGHTKDFTAVTLSSGTGSGSGALGERFASAASIDTVAVGQRFYATHPDNFDQLVVWSDQSLVQDAFSYEINVANEIQGIGQGPPFDESNSYGSGGALRSFVFMNQLSQFPDDPTQKFLGENNTLSVMGQEVGHRWLAYLQFRDHTGATSNALLGRDLEHWSFFLNSDASVMEGNQIQDLGGGQFTTTDAVKRYSMLDQYVMGLVAPSDVPSFFYVENPVSTKTPASAPQIGVSFTGTRRDVLISDVIAVEGPRIPATALSRTHRQAFIYVVSNGASVDSTQVAKVDKIRQAWESFFLQATGGRMTALTKLQ